MKLKITNTHSSFSFFVFEKGNAAFFAMFFSCFFVMIIPSFAQTNKEDKLAFQYLENGEYDKAELLYEKFFDKSPSSYYSAYMKCILGTKNFSKAEKIIKKQIKKYPDSLNYAIELGKLYKLSGENNKAIQQFEKTIKELGPIQDKIVILANAFVASKEYDYAVATYLKGRKYLGANAFRYELAEVYNQKQDITRMLEEYFDILLENEAYIQSVQNILQSKLAYNPAGNNSDIVKNLLLERIQKYPDRSIYSELLTWLFIQQKQFEAALIQSKALDKRMKEDGARLINLAMLCVSNESYDVAIKAYQYVITKEKTTSYYVIARTELLKTINKKIISTGNVQQSELLDLEKEYIKTLDELGKNASTASMIRNLAHLQAFYLGKTDDALALLKEVVKMTGLRPQEIAECKLELGDIYILKNEVWEATLLYSQVDKAFKTDVLGQEAKFRNAKLSYYQGDFDWAKAQLDVLKAATSDLMANDALALSLLIGDNLADGDTLQTTLHIYSRADLLLFQNKNDQAIQVLDSIKMKFPASSLNDDVLYKKAEIMMKMTKYEQAAQYFQEIITSFPKDVLADDALYSLAQLTENKFNNKEKAMELYQDLMTKYPSSLFVVEARKKFRSLRGDSIN